MILLCFALLSVFGSKVAKFSGAGALGVLIMSTVSAYGWTQDGKVRYCNGKGTFMSLM